jgi:hypothetical protein
MRTLLAVCAVLLALGCGDSTAPAGSVAGTWNLKTVNGFSVPFVSPQGGGSTVELTSDVITATASGTFTQMTVVKTTTGGQVTIDSIPDAGTYTISGHTVTFDFTSDAPTGSGDLDGSTLTVRTDITLVYKRQE